MRRVDKLSASYVDSGVSYVPAVSRCEKQHVSRLKIGRRYRHTVIGKAGSGTIHRVTKVSVAIIHKAGAVKTRRRGSAVDIGNAEECLGISDNLRTRSRSFRGGR